jgi:hypothetical protein
VSLGLPRLGLALGLLAAAQPALAQSQADRTGYGRAVAGQELVEYPGFTFPILVGLGAVAAVLGGYLAITGNDDQTSGAAPASITTTTTTTTR